MGAGCSLKINYLTSRTAVREVGKDNKMEAIKPRSFKKMFERPANKNNFLDNVTINNSSAINEMVKPTIEPTIEPDNNVNNIIEMRNEPIASEGGSFESNNIQEKVEIEKLKNDLFAATSKYENEHKTVEELNKQIEQLNQEINDIKKKYNEETETQAAAADELRKKYESKCNEYSELKNQYDLLETAKNELETQLVNDKDSSSEDTISIDVEEDIIHGEVTSTMAENERLSALNNELELQLINEIETRENAQMLYQELRSIMVSIGIEKNLEVFDQTKIELQQKANIIAQQERLLNERDQYITSIQNSLMDGIGQMFLKRPTETVLVLNSDTMEPEPVKPEMEEKTEEPAQVKSDSQEPGSVKPEIEIKSEDPTQEKSDPQEPVQESSDEIKNNRNESNNQDKQTSGQDLLTDRPVHQDISANEKATDTENVDKTDTNGETDEKKAAREKKDEYFKYLNENWIDIKKKALELKAEGWQLEDIAEMLEVKIRMVDLKRIIKKPIPKNNRTN